jgi:ribokinase
MYDIITIGSATVDIFIKTEFSETLCFKYHKHNKQCYIIGYPVGDKILIKELHFTTGGGGTNTAVSFSRFGLKTAYLGNLGKDENLKLILGMLKKERVNFIGNITKDRNNLSIILDSKKHDRTILAYKGASHDFRFSMINKRELCTNWFYFSSMTGHAYKELEKLADFASKNNIKIVFNPSCYLAEKGFKYLRKLLRKVNILILNYKEAQLISKKKKINELLKFFIDVSIETVVITGGDKGAYAYDGKVYYYIKPHKIKILETTGAGDAFASGFIAGLIKKNNIEFALQLGLANAESVISHYGAKNKLLRYSEALRIIKKNPGKIKKKEI